MTISFDTVIIGAGLAGLTTAYRLKQAGRRVVLVDTASRAGGVVRTEHQSGYLLEFGPNTVQPTGEIMSLLEDLGLKDVLLADARLPRYVRMKGRLYEVPLSPRALITTPLLSLGARLRLFLEPLVPRGGNAEESVLAFAQRRLGPQIAERLVSPFISGIWAGNSATLSVASAFPRLAQMERKSGSVLLGMIGQAREKKRAQTRPVPRGLLSFPAGLQTLVDRMAGELSDSLRLGQRIERVRPEHTEGKGHRWFVTVGMETIESKAVVFACPASDAARMAGSFAPEAAIALADIPYAPLALLHMGFDRKQLASDLKGFGYLSVQSKDADVLGSVWNSSIFPGRAPQGKALVTCFMGGAIRPEFAALSETEIIQAGIRDMRGAIGMDGTPSFTRVTQYPRAIPQYTLGHAGRISAISAAEKKFGGSLRFAGNYMEGISVGDVIRQATVVAGAL